MKILSFLKPYKVAVIIALLLMFVELAVELLQPLVISKIIDEGILKEDLATVLVWGGILLLFSLFAFASGIINSFYSSHASQNFSYDIREKMYEKIQSFSFTNFAKFPTSSLITRLTNDVIQVQNTVFMFLRIALRSPLLVIGSMILGILVNWKLALILVVIVPIIILFLMWIMRKVSVLFKRVQSRLDGVNSVMQENLIGMRLIKAFLRRAHEVKRFTASSRELREKTQTALRVTEFTMPAILLIMNVSIMAMLWFGSVQINTGSATEGEVVALINYATRMIHALSVISMVIMNLSRAGASAQRINEVLDTDIDLTDKAYSKTSNKLSKGGIIFDHVSFHYPGKNAPVLNDISFEIKPGETLAIMGATGSGKTSLFQLIPRLYEATAGKIIIDGIEVSEYKLEHLRRQIGYVPQEALLFTGTVKENIAWGKENASMDDIVTAAKHAQIHDTIMKLPMQYDTVIGQRGVNLSGGQKQRLSIARALVRNPKILLLDDSTSALDVKTESHLLQALKDYSCTILMITQKISSTRFADDILLLDDGSIAAYGHHDDLLLQSELYRKIYESQFGEGVHQHAKSNR